MDHPHHLEEARVGQRVTIVGAVSNLLLSVVKLIVGKLAHSQALVADAVHSLSDLFTDAIVLVGLRLGRSGPDEHHHFGHRRLETLATALVGITLIGVGVGIGYDAATAIYRHAEARPAWPALIAAGASIVVKEWLYHYTVRAGRTIHSPAMIANAWHHRSDALSSVAVLFGVGAALIEPAWHVLDAFAALLVSVLIVKVGSDAMWGALKEMTDAAPGAEVIAKIRATVTAVAGVIEAHDLKVRSSGGVHFVEAHVVVDGELSVTQGHRIAQEVERRLLREVQDVAHVIVHVDPNDLGIED